MSRIEEYVCAEMVSPISHAIETYAPARVTVQGVRGWLVFNSRLTSLENGVLSVELLHFEGDAGVLAVGQDVGLSFRQEHYQYLVRCVLSGMTAHRGQGGQVLPLLKLTLPERFHRVGRRAYDRCTVPQGVNVPVSFWAGGLKAHGDEQIMSPVYEGRLTSLSAGGFQLMTSFPAERILQVGENVGVTLRFGASAGLLDVEAQFRYARDVEGGALAGFQFVGLMLTSEGRLAMSAIVAKTDEFLASQAGAA